MKTNQELKLAKEQYQNLFNSNPLPCWVYDLETLYFLDVNAAAIRDYGYTRDEFLSMTIRQIRPEEDVPILEDIIKYKVKPGLFGRDSVRHTKKSGEIISVITEGNSLIYEERQARIVTAVDITEKLRTEQALSMSEKRFKSLIQEGSDLIAILDPAGKYLYVSPTSETVLSLKPEYFVNRNAFEFVHKDDLERIAKEFSLLTSQNRIKISPYRFAVGQNEYRWIETIITDMTADPAVAGIVANSRDVTQRIEHEIRIRESIERFDIVSRATSDAIYDLNFSTGKILWNKGIKGIFGYKEADQFTSDWWHENIHPDDIERASKDLQNGISEHRSRMTAEYRFRCADGSYKYVLDRFFLIYDEGQSPVRMIGSLQDITENVRYIKDIEEQNCRLREISWMQSHVVRAPLARLMGLASLIKDEKGISEELITHFSASANELDQIIRTIVRKTENF